jgi:hypothetical protein
MSSVAVLPSALHQKLAAAAQRVRRLRAIRGFSLLMATLILSGAAALALDAWLGLPGVVRLVLLCGWVSAGAGIAIGYLLIPLVRRIDSTALAALVEEKYADLGERLTSSVELTSTARPANGSPALIGLLLEETEARTSPLDFPQAVPQRSAVRSAAVAGFALLLLAGASVIMPQRLTNLCQRFFFPLEAPSASVGYHLLVEPGTATAARGRPLTLTARLEARYSHAELPHAATLVLTNPEGVTSRLPMVLDKSGFAFRIESVAGDFHYQVEAGAAQSDEYEITAVEPINLAAGGPTITITPPEYARKSINSETVNGFHDLSALQYSRVRLDLQFTQPAREAVLFWPGEEKDKDLKPVGRLLTLAPDQQSGSVELPALTSGRFTLLLRGANGFDTELAGGELAVRVDQPPAVAQFTVAGATVENSAAPRAVPPSESVPLNMSLTDDVAVASAVLEYQVNGGSTQQEEIALQGGGTAQAAGRHILALSGKVKDGDEVRYRLRITDNREVPEAGLKPHVIYFPAERWLGLKIASQSKPLAEQEIQAQRDDIDKRLDAIRKELEREQRGVYKLRQETRSQPSLLPEQTQELQSLQKDHSSSREALDRLAQEAAQTPDLQEVAEQAQKVADEELRRGETDLADSLKEESAPKRQQQLNEADKELAAALSKIDALRKANDRAARERMDQAKLDAVAQRQEELARRAENVAAKDPVKDPTTKPQTEQLQREQQQVAEELQRTANQSEPLKKALEEARSEQARQLGEQAKGLAKEERDLAKQGAPALNKKIEKLLEKQQQLAGQASKLARETNLPAKAAQSAPLRPDEANNAAEALKQGDAARAMSHQEQAANELDRAAADLDRAAKLSSDPKEVARQLARLQQGLQEKLNEETRTRNDRSPLSQRIKPIEREQEAIAKAAKALSVPPQNEPVKNERKQAAEQADKAAEALQKQDPRHASARMEQARQALERLADRMPSLPQRQQEAMAEVQRLKQRQEEIARQTEEAGKHSARNKPQAEQQLADAARKQADVADRLGKLDAPQQEASQESAKQAAGKALKDLLDGKPEQRAHSQQTAQQELKRLENAIAGRTPANPSEPHAPPQSSQASTREAARALARQQRDLAQATQHAREFAEKQPEAKRKEILQGAMKGFAEQQKELEQKAAGLPVDQAPKSVVQARQAMKEAEQAAAKGDAAQAKQKQDEAAAALDRLGQQFAEQPAPAAAEKPGAPPRGLPRKDQADQAHELARQQRELRDEVRRLLDEAQRVDQKPQQELQEKAGKLAQTLDRFAQQMNGQPQLQQAAHRAKEASQQASNAMQQAQNQSREGNQGQARASQTNAAEALERAGRELTQAMAQQPSTNQQTGQELQTAQNKMNEAQDQLGKGQRQSAQNSMKQAAQALQQAAQQMAQKSGKPTRGGQPNPIGAAPGGEPDREPASVDLKKYAGKRWGELPGALQTRIIQDLKTKYGDDYARIIKLYFQEIAADASTIRAVPPVK